MRLVPGLAFALLLAAATPLNAAVVFEIGSTSFEAGGTGSVDVFLTSNAGPLELDTIDVEFFIAREDSGFSYLHFVGQNSETFVSDPDYLFFQNSGAIANGDTVTQIGNFPGSSDFRLLFNDSAADGTNITIQENERFLLATLEMFHFEPLEDPSRFVLSVSGFVFNDGNPVLPTVTPFGFVDITAPAASAVPEPASAVAFAVLLIGAYPKLRRKRQTGGVVTSV